MNFGTDTVYKYITGIVLMIVLFLLLADLMPEFQSAGDDLNSSGVPLGSLFASGGIIFLIVMAGVLIFIVKGVLPKK